RTGRNLHGPCTSPAYRPSPILRRRPANAKGNCVGRHLLGPGGTATLSVVQFQNWKRQQPCVILQSLSAIAEEKMTSHANLSRLPLGNDRRDVVVIARELGPVFAGRAAAADENDRFVAENYQALKESGLVEAGVPLELGGGGAEVAALADMLR